MPFTSSAGFKNDVFVSYAHADDALMLDNEFGWVVSFVDNLDKQLKKKLGTKKDETPIIWKDEQLAYNKPLDKSLIEEISSTAMLLIIMSPAYLKSEWCKKERLEFLKIVEKKAEENRVMIVEIDEMDDYPFPEELGKNLLTCRFYSKEKGTKAAKTLGMTEQGDDYYELLINLAQDLSNELKKIKDKPSEKCNGNIFLAHVSDDLLRKRNDLKVYLKSEGYKILPDDRDNRMFFKETKSEIEEAVSNLLEESIVYIQLFSSLQGDEYANIEDNKPEFQFKLAANYELKCINGSRIKMLNWKTSDFEVEQIEDAGFKTILESESVRAGNFEEFKLAILPEIKAELNRRKKPVFVNPTKASKLVYICTDTVDKEFSKKIIGEHIKNRNEEIDLKKLSRSKIDCFFPLDNAGSDQAREVHDKYFLNSDAALFVYCNSNPGTMIDQILLCLKINTKRTVPFEIVAVYDGPPDSKAKIDMDLYSLNYKYLNCRFDEAEFEKEFLDVL